MAGGDEGGDHNAVKEDGLQGQGESVRVDGETPSKGLGTGREGKGDYAPSTHLQEKLLSQRDTQTLKTARKVKSGTEMSNEVMQTKIMEGFVDSPKRKQNDEASIEVAASVYSGGEKGGTVLLQSVGTVPTDKAVDKMSLQNEGAGSSAGEEGQDAKNASQNVGTSMGEHGWDSAAVNGFVGMGEVLVTQSLPSKDGVGILSKEAQGSPRDFRDTDIKIEEESRRSGEVKVGHDERDNAQPRSVAGDLKKGEEIESRIGIKIEERGQEIEGQMGEVHAHLGDAAAASEEGVGLVKMALENVESPVSEILVALGLEGLGQKIVVSCDGLVYVCVCLCALCGVFPCRGSS